LRDPLLNKGTAFTERERDALGLLAALQEELVSEKITGLEAASHPDSIYAGAIGAALWGEFRHQKLKELQDRVAA
jgi:benzoyl-CoA reductase subunit D